jgi:hypothetical protein
MDWFNKYSQTKKEDGTVVIDTAAVSDPGYADYYLGNAGWFENGRIHTIHLTDDPEKVKETLSSNAPITSGRGGHDVGDLGGGLYGSNAPNLWVGRARKKYDFLDSLNNEQRKKLGEAILAHRNLHEKGYLSESEREYAEKTLRYWMSGQYADSCLATIAGQPYNIHFWEPSFLIPLGIEPSPQPKFLEIELEGAFVKVDGGIGAGTVAELRREYDGAFIAGYMSYPQIVVWKNSSIKAVKEFVPER